VFGSSFTMSEQEHRQWTPYKHGAPSARGSERITGSALAPMSGLAWGGSSII
jgi:hypothetical protein